MIAGNVLEAETGKPLPDATVALQLHVQTANFRTAVTDRNGNFEFDQLPAGVYRLVLSNMGFAGKTIDSIHIRDERYDFNLSDIRMTRSATQLQEVIVYAEKPLIENRDGKITYNVSESALSGGSSTAEILKNMPLISNDPEGKILLKGKEPKILIDDKPADLNAQQLADLLESLPGGSIEKIELMTNPPPQYASEPGGVINIVTRKGKVGVVGRVTLSGGTRGEGRMAANVSYRSRKFTMNVNAGAAINKFTGGSYSRRENRYTDSTNYLHTDATSANANIRPNVRVQLDYDFTKEKSLAAVLQTNFNVFDNENLTVYKNLNKEQQVYKLSNRLNESEGVGTSNSATLTYTYKSDSTPERLQVIAGGGFGYNNNDKNFHQQYLLAQAGLDSVQQQEQRYDNSSYSFRINYDKPLPLKRSLLSTGVWYTGTTNHNVLSTFFLNRPLELFEINDLLSNDFRFTQHIYAARAALNVRVKEWSFTGGVQMEHTNNGFRFAKGNGENAGNSYVNWLPTATIRREFGKTLNTSLVYRATIRRPGINELNPNIDYNDPYNIRFGNPALLPTLSHNIDWNFSLVKGKYYFNTSAGYNRVKDVFNSIRTLAGNGITEVTFMNIAGRHEYEASVWGGYTFSKRLRINASTGYTYNEYGEEEKRLYKYRDGGSFYTSFNYSYTPTSLLQFEGNARYNSFADPQGRARSNLTTNFGVQRKFFKKRLIILFNVIDPFSAQSFTRDTYGTRFTLHSYHSTNTRNFRLTVIYQLNKIQQRKSSPAKK